MVGRNIPKEVSLNYIEKQLSMSEEASLNVLCFGVCLWVPALISCPDLPL